MNREQIKAEIEALRLKIEYAKSDKSKLEDELWDIENEIDGLNGELDDMIQMLTEYDQGIN